MNNSPSTSTNHQHELLAQVENTRINFIKNDDVADLNATTSMDSSVEKEQPEESPINRREEEKWDENAMVLIGKGENVLKESKNGSGRRISELERLIIDFGKILQATSSNIESMVTLKTSSKKTFPSPLNSGLDRNVTLKTSNKKSFPSPLNSGLDRMITLKASNRKSCQTAN